MYAAAYSSTTDCKSEYRRQARRLRAVHARSPVMLQQSLAQLAARVDRVDAGQSALAISSPSSGVQRFAAAVASSLDGPVLRYSNRQRLIDQAAALGIRRFDANLLIAAVQNRLAKANNQPPLLIPPTDTARRRWVIPAATVAILQCIICVAAYRVLHGL